MDELLLVLIADEPAHEEFGTFRTGSRGEDGTGLRPEETGIAGSLARQIFRAVEVCCEREGACSIGLADKVGRLAGTTDPLDILLKQCIEPLPTVVLDDDGEEIGDSIVVIGVGQCELTFPDRVDQLAKGRGHFPLIQEISIIDQVAKLVKMDVSKRWILSMVNESAYK